MSVLQFALKCFEQCVTQFLEWDFCRELRVVESQIVVTPLVVYQGAYPLDQDHLVFREPEALRYPAEGGDCLAERDDQNQGRERKT